MKQKLKDIFSAHVARYPLMTAQDAVKLLYQNHFGPGHMISDPESAMRRLFEEWSGVPHDPDSPLLENIGNGFIRVHLSAWSMEELSPQLLCRDFLRSAHSHRGEQEGFLDKLNLLHELVSQGGFPFSAEELQEYLSGYAAAGYPAVSHSEVYRKAYHPAYRVIHRDCFSLSPALVIHKASCRRQVLDRPLLIAIDGRCASGKTTLAATLQRRLGCCVIHMDDFFLRPEQRTRQRYETPGENVDHERFLTQVLLPLSKGQAAVFRPFDCSTMQFGRPIRVEPSPIVVVEGSYSCHKDLFPYYDLTVFLSISPHRQMDRIITREGDDYARVFRDKWIPLEEAYFAARNLEDICDFSFPCGSAEPDTEDS